MAAKGVSRARGMYTWTVDASTDTPEYTPIGDRTWLATIIDDPEAYEAI